MRKFRLPIVVAAAGAALLSTATLAGATPAKSTVPAAHAVVPAPGKTPALTPSVTSSGKPPGYQIVNSGPLVAPNNSQTFGTATCPGTKKVLGGGVYISANGPNATINSSEPSGRSWDAFVNNTTGADMNFKVYAVCGNTPSTLYHQVSSSSTPNPAGTQSSVSVSCPRRTSVLGGGGLSSSSSPLVAINTSIFTSNGWRVDMSNASSSDATATARTVCAKKPLGYVKAFGATVTNPANTQTFATAACPTNTYPLGGGAYSSSGLTSVNLNTSYPISGGWGVFVENGSGSDASITPYVICAGTASA